MPTKILDKSSFDPALRTGKDEMNLVEHPFALLSVGGDERSLIEIEWDQEHPKTRRLVHSVWRVAGDPKLGLPTPTDEKIYLVLMEMTREARTQTVLFSRANLLCRLGMSDNNKNYLNLRDSLTRLKNVNIRAERAFWNPKIQDFDPIKLFSILDEVTIADEPRGRKAQGALPLSSFKWSDALWSSMQDGHIRTVDLSFALSLGLPLSLRLFRYLDKKRHGGRDRFEIDIARLCEIHLGMKPNRFVSKYWDRLGPAHEELVERKFLTSVDYEEMKTRKGKKVVYSFRNSLTPVEETPEEPAALSAPATVDETEEWTPEEVARNSPDDLCDVRLERLKFEDTEEWQRIYDDARALLGEIDVARLQRDAGDRVALHNLQMHMREILRTECWWMLIPERK